MHEESSRDQDSLIRKGTTKPGRGFLKYHKKRFRCCRQRPETEYRFLGTHDPDKNKKYGNNEVSNTKYSWWSFLPKIIFAHLSRFMNLYFIMIGCLQLWRDVAPVEPWTTWVPIGIIFSFTFAREGIDNIRVYLQDRATNGRLYDVYRGGSKISERGTKSERIMCGDIIVLHRDQETPCDITCLYTSEAGECYIGTSNLNGETALQKRKAVERTQDLGEEELLSSRICVSCCPANSEVYSFDGYLKIGGWGHDSCHLENENFIPGGTHIRSNGIVIGFVCYTGKRTKLGLNSKMPPVKWTRIEKFINKCSGAIFGVQIVLALIFGSIANNAKKTQENEHPYLRIDLGDSLNEKWAPIILYVRVYLLASVMIPVSMKIIIDALKYMYAIWITNDRRLYSRRKQAGTTVNNTSVIEDLGAVQYLFSDKTGTMTQNEMKLQRLAAREFVFEDLYGNLNEMREAMNGDARFWLEMMIVNLSVCHSVKIRSDNFEGVSPEEIAFLEALTEMGISFEQEDDNNIALWSDEDKLGIPRVEYEIVLRIPFKEERKHMAVVVRNKQTDKLYLFSKGAHETIQTMCTDIYPGFESQSESFTGRGLRVMALAFKEVDHDSLRAVLDEETKTNELRIDERTRILDQVYGNFEQGQAMIGLTGIEDKLQKGVPETIQMLREAGIRIWMVTGDAPRTAINIAYSTGLLAQDGPLIDLTHAKGPGGTPKYSADEVLESVYAWAQQRNGETFYLMVDGTSPLIKPFIEDKENRFGKLASLAKCVICARTAPKQKAKYVECIQRLKKMTLAIGDGGNDVTMLNAAHVGIGIMGKEGRQAAAAADIAIHKFYHLQRLILIHGRYAAYRSSWLMQFCFYKAIMLVVIQFGYMFWNGFSAISFIGNFNLVFYNIVFTLLPVIIFLFDKDIDESFVYMHPYIYVESRKHTFCNPRTFFWWIVRALYQGLCILIAVQFSCTSDNLSNVDGIPISKNETQQIAYGILILVVLVTTTFDTKFFTMFHAVFVWGSWPLYIVLTTMINALGISRESSFIAWRSFTNVTHWLVTAAATSLCVIPVMFVQSIFAIHLPMRSQELHEEITMMATDDDASYIDAVYFTRANSGRSYIVSSARPAYDDSPTVWDANHNLCTPLCTLCGCSNMYA